MYQMPSQGFIPPQYHPLLSKREAPYSQEDSRSVKRQRRNSGDQNNDGGSSDDEEEDDEDAKLFG
jgi:hypothetical protein